MPSSRTTIEWTFEDPQVELRLRPLREHWEARGPGMLRYMCKQLPWLDLPEHVRVHLVLPTVSGGGGELKDGHIEFEAVLANPYPTLPEVVRLAWLILRYAVSTDQENALALIPVSVEAGEYVELTKLDNSTVELAMNKWIGNSERTGESMLRWWKQQQQAETNWQTWNELELP